MTTSTSSGPAFLATPRCDTTQAWRDLQSYFETQGRHFDVRQALQAEPQRFAQMAIEAPHVRADFSRNLLDASTLQLLNALAQQCQLQASIDALFSGLPLNTTEGRAAWHVLLRCPPGFAPEHPAMAQALMNVQASQDAFLSYAEQVRLDESITDVVNIGIGGSDLGPAVVVQALEAYRTAGKRIHFVSNMDGDDLGLTLRGLDPARTLFLVASKSFGTAETMVNAQVARAWLLAAHGYVLPEAQQQGVQPLPDDVPDALRALLSRRFVAMTSNAQAANAFGITTIFPFADWVGGRFSLWSSIGLSIAIAIGTQHFRALLTGAHAMDQHFRTTPVARNLPVQLALLDIWYRNFHGFPTRCIAPYSHGLRRLPAYLQQLEMESNGKGCDWNGDPITLATAPVIWGEAGTNCQHAFFQLIHQGPQVIPVEFIVLREHGLGTAAQHRALQANAVAQARALTFGKHDGPAYKHCPGNRPSTMLVLDRLDPASVGALIALYEHRTFVAGRLWGINSFDQWGVELGKSLAKEILAAHQPDEAAAQDVMRWLR
ncbi:glucose-6-phosphate isomerase [Lampropedia cohaerens]|uniref:Glucose-6-phosphate isomerase n=2 Tax=Lampropedia cohaerens TaxID=1610491 RepID=A0A0U1PX02_9BURK|nr:glucose-6-phosphate isomerase [Lampropedia cohaerens]